MLFAALLMLSGAAATARADEPTGRVPVGGGTGIALPEGPWFQTPAGTLRFFSYCTLTAIGYDALGNLIGLTNAHCMYEDARQLVGDEVFSWTGVTDQGAAHDVRALGTVEYIGAGNPIVPGPNGVGLDYGIIVFDKSRVEPVDTVGGTTIRRIAAPPPPGTPVCKQGYTSGRTCGNTVTTLGPYLVTTVSEIPGDSGAPVVSGDALVGNSWMWGGSSSITAIIADMDARGGVGAGFHLDFGG
ncbi:protease [Nocardia heshunensis]